MITVSTMGGLGNQMFQYALGIAQADRLKTGLLIDKSRNKIDSFRPFNLPLFQINEPIIEETGGNVIRERSLVYDPAIDSVKDGATLVGYWQSELYFQSVESTIRRRFRSANLWTPEALDFADLIRSKGHCSVMLGVRRTDYVAKEAQIKFHGSMPYSYYESALKVVSKIRNQWQWNREDRDQKPVVFVFSDDIEWVKNNWDFGLETYYWMGDKTVPNHIGREDMDLGLMSLCSSAIIANSSFHWWGAWLGDHLRDGVVVAPSQWFADPKAQEQASTICPNRWLRI